MHSDKDRPLVSSEAPEPSNKALIGDGHRHDASQRPRPLTLSEAPSLDLNELEPGMS
jgi:hypothetical protein